MYGNTAARLTFALTCVLAWLAGHAQADFGSGTITFEESSYQLYYDTSGVGTNFVPYTTANGANGGSAYTGINSSTGVLTVSDDQSIPLDAWFQVQNSGSQNVYVRFGFDISGTSGSLDSADTPAVLEATYGGTSAETGSGGDIFAYTSSRNGTGLTDYVESGYESQAGSFFVRARKDENGGGESNETADKETWDSFIIDYAGASVTEATGEIWDIDANNSEGAEKFAVTVTGSSASVTDGTYTVTENSPTGLLESDADSLDAKPWQFAFGSSDGFTDIDQIKITRFEDSGSVYKPFFPLAFNNFNPVSSVGFFTPEPSSLLAFGGIFSLAVLRRQRRKHCR